MVARHERRLRGFLARLAGPDRGDDLAQDAFLQAWRRAGEYAGRGSYAGWLYRIAWRLFLDDRRSAGRTAAREAAAQSGEPKIDTSLDAALDAERLLQMLDQRSRAALVLCEGHGWSHSEAAAMLGLPLGTLKSLVSRAKARLRNAVKQGEPL